LGSLPHRVAVAASEWIMDPSESSKAAAADLILSSAFHPTPKLEDAIAAYEELLHGLKMEQAALVFKQKCRDTFPLATFFGAKPIVVNEAVADEADMLDTETSSAAEKN